MQQKRFAIAAAVLALAAVMFTVGFFVGRGSVNPVITVSRLEKPDSGAASGLLTDPDAGTDTATEPGGQTTGVTENSGLVNINTASAAELERLPGIGSVLAERIVQYRLANGKFSTIEEIKNVSGIGEGKFSDIKSLITTD